MDMRWTASWGRTSIVPAKVHVVDRLLNKRGCHSSTCAEIRHVSNSHGVDAMPLLRSWSTGYRTICSVAEWHSPSRDRDRAHRVDASRRLPQTLTLKSESSTHKHTPLLIANMFFRHCANFNLCQTSSWRTATQWSDHHHHQA
jgi:hypothetical protein